MRNALHRKLKSQSGASLLLALLFLLICMMVSASILMAAVSHAGKHRSNLEEHQTYLAISSAVSALCDELNRTAYQGQYRYWETEEQRENPDGTVSTVTHCHFQQLDGVYQTKQNETGYLNSVLLSDFDAIFAEEIKRKLNDNDFLTFSTKSGAAVSHVLTVTPQTGTELDDKEIKVQMTVLEESYAIEIKASLDDYHIQAELTPITNKPTLPSTLIQGDHKTDPLKWEIGWITAGEKR